VSASACGFRRSSGGQLTRRSQFNLTAGAWRQLRRNWDLPLSPRLAWQSFVAGPLFSALQAMQRASTVKQCQQASLAGSIFVLGYWRSGTTLLHEYLCHDDRFGFPSTYACMQPQHFVLTQPAALRRPLRAVRRPMDDVRVTAGSPQEDEFALLALGARSPYEALIAPRRLAEALALGDPLSLSPRELCHWRKTFLAFLNGVSAVEGGRPLVLKSPPHGYRLGMLRELFPDSYFVLVVRAPEIVYESTVRMWRTLFGVYSMEAVPPEDDTRTAVLEDRPRFEAKLAEGLAGLRPDRTALVRYEELVQDPINVLGGLYEQLQLGGFAKVESAIKAELRLRGGYQARNAPPPEHWLRKLQSDWAPIYDKYQYPNRAGRPGK
jgi:omega-hydroxy-beta-dihydromenaquinone-9 sulfotransferase